MVKSMVEQQNRYKLLALEERYMLDAAAASTISEVATENFSTAVEQDVSLSNPAIAAEQPVENLAEFFNFEDIAVSQDSIFSDIFSGFDDSFFSVQTENGEILFLTKNTALAPDAKIINIGTEQFAVVSPESILNLLKTMQNDPLTLSNADGVEQTQFVLDDLAFLGESFNPEQDSENSLTNDSNQKFGFHNFNEDFQQHRSDHHGFVQYYDTNIKNDDKGSDRYKMKPKSAVTTTMVQYNINGPFDQIFEMEEERLNKLYENYSKKALLPGVNADQDSLPAHSLETINDKAKESSLDNAGNKQSLLLEKSKTSHQLDVDAFFSEDRKASQLPGADGFMQQIQNFSEKFQDRFNADVQVANQPHASLRNAE